MKNKKNRIRRNEKGEYILRQYFVEGKMKHEKIYVIDGVPVDEFYSQNADPITLLQNGDYDILNEQEF